MKRGRECMMSQHVLRRCGAWAQSFSTEAGLGAGLAQQGRTRH
jgi:hypothetical protein